MANTWLIDEKQVVNNADNQQICGSSIITQQELQQSEEANGEVTSQELLLAVSRLGWIDRFLDGVELAVSSSHIV